MGSFEKAVEDLREGRSTYEDFARATTDRWAAMARWLMRRWHLPGWVEPGDIVQELLVGAWKATWRYDCGRGSMPLDRFVRVSAVNDALKAIHQLRGADPHTRSGPSRVDRPFSSFGDDVEGMVDAILSTPAEQEEALEAARQRKRAMAVCETLEELLSVQALALAQSFLGGAAIMWEDAATREMLALRSEAHAARIMVRATHVVAQRMTVAA